MPPLLIPPCLVLLCLAMLGLAAPVAAQTEIHRCIGAQGGAVFTDQPCAALQATPVRAGSARTEAAASSAPPPVLCATSVDELRQSVIDAFARRDANRLAGLILWHGYGRGAAIADIRALTVLMKRPLLDIDTPPAPATSSAPGDDAFPPQDEPASAPSQHDQLVVHIVGDGADRSPAAWRFDLVHVAGCLWLRSAR